MVAAGLSRAPSAISREVAAHGGCCRDRALLADRVAWKAATRPKSCKLAGNLELRDIVEAKLRLRWGGQLATENVGERLECELRRRVGPC